MRPLLLGLALIAMLVPARALGLGDRLGELRTWITGLGALGPVVFILLYAVAVVAAIPGSLLTIAAGAMFGSVLGVVAASTPRADERVAAVRDANSGRITDVSEAGGRPWDHSRSMS